MFASCFGLAQQKKSDSLKTELGKHPQQDTSRVRLLTLLALSYCFINADTGMILTDQAAVLAKKLNDPIGLGDAYNIKGICFYTKGAFDTSLNLHKMALDIYTKENNIRLMVRALNRMGGSYTFLSNYPEALNVLQRSSQLAEKINDKVGQAAANGNIGLIYANLGDDKKAMEYNTICLNLYQSLGDSLSVAIMYTNLASMCLANKTYEKAMEYSFKALKINDSLKLKTSVGRSYLLLGIIYEKLGKYSLALDYLNKSLVLFEQVGAKNGWSSTLANIAKVYDLAPDSVLIKAGLKPSERFSLMLQYQYSALQLAKESNDLDDVSKQWKTLSGFYEKNKKFDSAFYAYREYSIIHDSIVGDKKRQDITRQEMRFEAGKKEAVLNAEHSATLNRQQLIRNAIIGGSSTLLITGLVIFSFYKRKRDAVEKQKEAELRSQVTETEMKALRSQMNPHFIFNSLNSISDYIAKHNTRVADEYLSKFANLMRLILENSEKREVPLANDLVALELYMQLESLRMNNKFSYEIKVDDAIDKENTLVPPLILQPFVENSIWHGIAKKEGQGRIIVSIKQEGDMINCVVEDDGIGRKEAALVINDKNKKSLGMKITKERIDILNKIKNSNAAIYLTDLKLGTRVEVKLPLELSF